MIITEEILGVKGLTLSDKSLSFEKCWKLLMKQGEAWRIILQSHCTIFFFKFLVEKNYISVLMSFCNVQMSIRGLLVDPKPNSPN